MRVTDKFREGSTLFSFEILPPQKGKNIDHIYQAIDTLLPFDPAYINVTYHREEYIYKKREKGYLEKVAVRKRPGTVGICAAIKYKYNIEAVPHLICGGFSRDETENALIDLSFLGIHNVLALRGDPIKTETHFVPSEGGNASALELVQQIRNLGRGQYMDEDVKDADPLDFCVGVAGYPEKHFESPNLALDIHFLKQKIDAGADYIVTQLFYDNARFFDFVAKCREAGITVPIIPGIKPLSLLSHIKFMPKFFHVDLPEALTMELIKCKTDKDVAALGTEWAVTQCRELVQSGVPSIHFYTMGKGQQTADIAKAVY